MENKMRKMSLWMEVAPTLIMYPLRPSNTPDLETIAEEGHEGCDEDS
ncbi:hypothetical protein Acr_08g0017310 [Actinidia rufa]|uniref:Uncharacterized protein n=1 Tax=Actinidia rufa TaxID=165716 RepID=A0A7J0F3R8_9ERIC|nr:hypothetical protein Acr_08g0017310 [Actinidia rufa]